MKHIHVAALALLAVGSTAASAADDKKPSLEEYQAAVSKHLLKHDLDHDGKTNLAEFKEYRSNVQNARADAETLFRRVDTNQDGAIDKAESDAWAARRYARKTAAAGE